MMNFYTKLVALACFSLNMIVSANDIEFVIVILSYNNEKWAKDNLKSVCHQKSSKPYQVICVNDCSTDKTKEIMDKYVRKHNLESFVTVIHNEQRMGAMANWYNTIHSFIPDHKVVVAVDGDDVLAHNEVLLQLENRYADPDIWMTYGSVLSIPGGHTKMSEAIPRDVLLNRDVRTYPFKSQHLRTFKAGLFKKIKKEDCMYEGNFVPMTCDQAFMFPMLEMCAPIDENAKNHSVFIPEILYIYNFANPINDYQVCYDLQYRMGVYIRNLPSYEPLESL